MSALLSGACPTCSRAIEIEIPEDGQSHEGQAAMATCPGCRKKHLAAEMVDHGEWMRSEAIRRDADAAREMKRRERERLAERALEARREAEEADAFAARVAEERRQQAARAGMRERGQRYVECEDAVTFIVDGRTWRERKKEDDRWGRVFVYGGIPSVFVALVGGGSPAACGAAISMFVGALAYYYAFCLLERIAGPKVQGRMEDVLRWQEAQEAIEKNAENHLRWADIRRKARELGRRDEGTDLK